MLSDFFILKDCLESIGIPKEEYDTSFLALK